MIGLLAVALTAAFAGVAALVELEVAMGESRFLLGLHDLVGDAARDLVVGIDGVTDVWPLVAVGAVAALGLVLAGRVRAALIFVASVAPVWALNPALKELFQRPRPELWPSAVPASEFGFPSGHAANTAALVAALVLALPAGRWRLAGAVLGGAGMVVVAFSQLALGVHYPSDILAGWLWAGAWVSGIRAVSHPRRPTTSE